ncbi:CinA family protein [Deltaproteobacteria bacterium TL4]
MARTNKNSPIPLYNLENTAFLLLTANPAGFHHLMLAECALRQMPELKKIVFVISNGKHPDPTKTTLIPEKHLRLEILRSLLKEYKDPQKSYLAQLAKEREEFLRLYDAVLEISTIEFDQDLAFRLSDHLRFIRKQSHFSSHSQAIKIIVGADLLNRINNPNIFSDMDLEELQSSGEFLALPRDHYDIDQELLQIQKGRKTTLQYDKLDAELLPESLRIFLKLSSTQLRCTVQAGHSLKCYLPTSTAEMLYSFDLYREGVDDVSMTEWNRRCWQFEQELDKLIAHLKRVLDERARQGLSHTLAIVETSTGGKIASAFTSWPGASAHFKESLIPYDYDAKARLLRQAPTQEAIVSKAMAMGLAQAYQAQTNADIVLAETGMAGPPDGYHRSSKNGQCCLALMVKGVPYHTLIQSNPFLSKKEHQLQFSACAAQWVARVLESLEDTD